MRVEWPWGWHEDLLNGPGYRVKGLLIRSGQQLSLQRHRYRRERWTVLAGDDALLCGERWVVAKAGLMLSVPCGAVHRARSETSDLVILEVQHGDDLREDDIERLQDGYGRVINLRPTFEA